MSQKAVTGGARRLVRRLRILAIGLTMLVAALVGALPSLIGMPPIRGWIVARVNQKLAPARVEVGSLELSWFGPTRISGFVLYDPAGKAMVSAPEVTLDRNARQLLLERPRTATLTLQGAAIDIDRRADGSIDLFDAFAPLMNRPKRLKVEQAAVQADSNKPETEFTLKVEQGKLRLGTPELAEPLQAERLDMTVRVPAAPETLSWTIALANPSASVQETLEITGHYDHRAKDGAFPELAATLDGHRWPIAPTTAGLTGRGRFDGKIEAKQREGGWMLSGDARVLDLDASGPALAGDRLRLDRVGGTWDLGQVDGRWSIRKLDLSSPVGSITASGSVSGVAEATGRIDAHVDLAALARQAPHALHLREGLSLDKGEVRLRAEVRNEASGPILDVEARVSDLNAREKGRAIALRDPATLTARLPLRKGSMALGSGAGSIRVKSAFFDLNGSGNLETGAKLSGSLDLEACQTQLRQLIDFGGLDLAGKARLAAAYRHDKGEATAQIAIEIQQPKITGLTAEPLKRSQLRLDLAAVGTAPASPGLPDTWRTARFHLKADDLTATIEATRKEASGQLAVKANASGTLPLGSTNPKGEGDLAGHWDGRILTIDDSHAAISTGPIAVSASGRFDRQQGTLDLLPKTRKGDTITLANEGVHLSGLTNAGTPPGIDGGLTLDLASLDRALASWTAGTPSDLGGVLTVAGNARLGSDRTVVFRGLLNSPNLSTAGEKGRGRTEEGALSLTGQGTYALAADRLDLSELNLTSGYGNLKGAGSLTELSGRRIADLQASVTPGWDRLKVLVLGSLAPEVMVGGDVKPFRLQGPLSGSSTADFLRGIETELRVDLTAIRAFGLHTAPMPVIIRCRRGGMTIDPISTAINGGRLELKPEVALDDPKGASFRLAAGSEIRDVEIDDEVSRRILAYCVPMLHNASQVRGKVSAAFDRAEIPMEGDSNRAMSAAGKILFKNVTYGPGAFGQQLLGLTGRSNIATAKLDQTITFEVANGRIKQEGLSIPVARDAQITLAGSVGFDSTLRLRAGVPVTPAMLGLKGTASDLAKGTKIDVPIGGTLSRPTIERRALQVGLRDAGKALLRGEASSSAAEALRRLPLPEGTDTDAIKNELQNLLKPRPKKR